MKIATSNLSLAANHVSETDYQENVALSQSFERVFASAQAKETRAEEEKQRLVQTLDQLVAAILAAVNGKKGAEIPAAAETAQASSSPETKVPSSPRALGKATWQCDITASYQESERTQMRGQGCVVTSDGRQIEFAMGLTMERSFSQVGHWQLRGEQTLQDPLAINFDGQGVRLDQAQQAFDLNSDGSLEWLPSLAKGNGYLVFDRNHNGQIDEGSELFGTQTGEGFADLAKLDDDHNGWIDEADSAWRQLQVWSGPGHATDSALSSLASHGVGALWTGAIEAPFSLKTTDNTLLGEIRSAGLYLKENGESGWLQQVDLATHSGVGTAKQQPAEREGLTTG